MLNIAGGIYREYCMHPSWREVYGSGGRAASAVSRIGGKATLHGYTDPGIAAAIESRAALEGFQLASTAVNVGVDFSYHHPLATPTIRGVPATRYPAIQVNGENVIRFGIIEGDAIIHADYAVYDPQNPRAPEFFSANGSTANHLAIVLNFREAILMTGTSLTNPRDIAQAVASSANAEVVVLKMGAAGSLVYENGSASIIQAFATEKVWKIGSGDNFVAHFGYRWMVEHRSGHEAARLASLATAYYCSHQAFATAKALSQFTPSEIRATERFSNGWKPKVYLAGPFFTLAQLWLIEQARNDLKDAGLGVFSPYHDVGRGSADDVVEQDLAGIRDCDVLIAIGDGLDAGTIYEIGYARALGKPVIFYAENESAEDRKMMVGSGCIICDDYTTAIYKTLWAVAEQ